MRILIQRASEASVTINSVVKSKIGSGLLILLGIEPSDTPEDADWLCKKVAALRIFDDEAGVMNKSIVDVDGEALVVSQFTLMASTKKGNRPSYIHASRPEFAVPMYEKFVLKMQELFGKEIQTGEFGADMQVALVNDGPVTIIMDSHQRERF
jgi:D-tyrosyl-tRNA(Tyr) deacylase